MENVNKIIEIITPETANSLYFPFGEENTHATFEKYKELDNVVAFRISDKYCYIIIKGKIKFFGFKIHMDNKTVKRMKEGLFELINHKHLCVVNKEYFGLLKKTLIVESLNAKR